MSANEKLQIIVEGIDNMSSTLDRIEGRINGFTTAVQKSSSIASVAGGIIATQFGANVTRALTEVGKESAQMAMDFEKTITIMTALTGRAGDQAEIYQGQMNELARSMGIEFGVGANAAAQALEQLVRAGIDPAKNGGDALAATLQLVAIEGIDAGEAAKILATSLYAFGEEQDRVNDYVDTFVRASAMGVDTASGYANGLTNVAATASGLGFAFEDTVAALVILDQRFGNAVEGGTYLNNLLIQLIKDSDKYGVTLYNTNGTLKTYDDIIGQLRENYQALLPDQAAADAYLAQFNIRAQYAARTLVNYDGTIQDVSDTLAEMGSAQDVATAALDTTAGQMAITEARLEELNIEIGKTTSQMQLLWKEFVAGAGPVGVLVDALGPSMLTGVMQGLSAHYIPQLIAKLSMSGLAGAFSSLLYYIGPGGAIILGMYAASAAFDVYRRAVGLTVQEIREGAAEFEYIAARFDDYGIEAEEARIRTDALIDPFERLGIVVEDVDRQAYLLLQTQEDLMAEAIAGTASWGEYVWAMAQVNTETGRTADSFEDLETSVYGIDSEIDFLIRRADTWTRSANIMYNINQDIADSFEDIAREAGWLADDLLFLDSVLKGLSEESDLLSIELLENRFAQRLLNKELDDAIELYGECHPIVKALRDEIALLEDAEWDLDTAMDANTIQTRKLMFIQGKLKDQLGLVNAVLEDVEEGTMSVDEAYEILGVESDALYGILDQLERGVIDVDDAFAQVTGTVDRTDDKVETFNKHIVGLDVDLEGLEKQTIDAVRGFTQLGQEAVYAAGKAAEFERRIEALKADLLKAKQDADSLRVAIGRIPNKTVTVTVKTVGDLKYATGGGIRVVTAQRAYHRAVQFRESTNVMVHPGEWVMGPPALQRLIESVNRSGGGGGGVQIHVTVTGNNISSDIDQTNLARQTGREIVHKLRAEGLWWLGR